jgi:hypothetical protein
MNMSDPQSRNNMIAKKLRELADLFHGVAHEVPDGDPVEKPAKGKKAAAPPADETPPVENDKTVTADHPKRAELQAVAKEYKEATSLEAAQKAMKLFGESSKLVPDDDLPGAIAHFKGLLKKLKAKASEDAEV